MKTKKSLLWLVSMMLVFALAVGCSANSDDEGLQEEPGVEDVVGEELQNDESAAEEEGQGLADEEADVDAEEPADAEQQEDAEEPADSEEEPVLEEDAGELEVETLDDAEAVDGEEEEAEAEATE